MEVSGYSIIAWTNKETRQTDVHQELLCSQLASPTKSKD